MPRKKAADQSTQSEEAHVKEQQTESPDVPAKRPRGRPKGSTTTAKKTTSAAADPSTTQTTKSTRKPSNGTNGAEDASDPPEDTMGSITTNELDRDVVAQYMANLEDSERIKLFNKAQCIAWADSFHSRVQKLKKGSAKVKAILKERVLPPSDRTMAINLGTPDVYMPWSEYAESVRHSAIDTFKQKLCFDILARPSVEDNGSKAGPAEDDFVTKSLSIYLFDWNLRTTNADCENFDVKLKVYYGRWGEPDEKKAVARYSHYNDSGDDETEINHGGMKALFTKVAEELEVPLLSPLVLLELLIGPQAWKRISDNPLPAEDDESTFTEIIDEQVEYRDNGFFGRGGIF